MGESLSKIGRRATTRFNFEHRAQKAIEKQTKIPKVAPRHPTTVDHSKEMDADLPKIKEELDRKNEALLEKLKHVKIDSFGPPPEIKSASSRGLPQNRAQVAETDLGFEEPDVIPPGKITVRTVIDVLGKHLADPKTFAAREIAAEHTLDKQKVENMLNYFQAFSLYIPKKGEVVAGKLKTGGTDEVKLQGDDKVMLDDGKDKGER